MKKKKVRERCKDRSESFLFLHFAFLSPSSEVESHLDSRDLRGLSAGGLVHVGLFCLFASLFVLEEEEV